MFDNQNYALAGTGAMAMYLILVRLLRNRRINRVTKEFGYTSPEAIDNMTFAATAELSEYFPFNLDYNSGSQLGSSAQRSLVQCLLDTDLPYNCTRLAAGDYEGWRTEQFRDFLSRL